MKKKGIELKNNSKIEITDDTGKITIYERENEDLVKLFSEHPDITFDEPIDNIPIINLIKYEDGGISYKGRTKEYMVSEGGTLFYLTLNIWFFSDKTGLIEISQEFPFGASLKALSESNDKKAIKNIRWKYIEESHELKEELLESTPIVNNNPIKLNLGDDEVLEYEYKSESEADNMNIIISKSEGDDLRVFTINNLESYTKYYQYDSDTKTYYELFTTYKLKFYTDNTMTLIRNNLDNSLNVKKFKLKIDSIFKNGLIDIPYELLNNSKPLFSNSYSSFDYLNPPNYYNPFDQNPSYYPELKNDDTPKGLLLEDNSTIEVTDPTTGETTKYESFILEYSFENEKKTGYIEDKSTNIPIIRHFSNENNQYVYTSVSNTDFKRTMTFFSDQRGTISTTGKPSYDISWKYIYDTPKGIVLEDNTTVEVTDDTGKTTIFYPSFYEPELFNSEPRTYFIRNYYDNVININYYLNKNNNKYEYRLGSWVNPNILKLTFFSDQTGIIERTDGYNRYSSIRENISWKYISDPEKSEDLDDPDKEIIISESRDVTNGGKTDIGIILLVTAFLFKKLK